MAWRLAHSIPVFHAQLKTGYPFAAPPATPNVQWGTIADLSHSSTSDHSPNDFAGWGNDIVTAADWPHRPDLGLDNHKVCESLRLSRDARIKYVIFNRRMFSSYAARGYPAWTWRPYPNTATDPHTDHAHLSVVGDARADGTQPWQIGADMALRDDPDFWYVMHRLFGLQTMQDPIHIPQSPSGIPARTEPNLLAQAVRKAGLTDAALAELQDAIDEAAAVVAAAPTLDAIGDVVDRELDEQSRGGADDDPPPAG